MYTNDTYNDLTRYGAHSPDTFRALLKEGFVFEMRRLQHYALIRVLRVDPRHDRAEIEHWVGEKKTRRWFPITKWSSRSWALKTEDDWLLAEVWGQYVRKDQG
jgi:hypothetical protein